MEVEQQLADKHVTLDIDEKARAWLAENGHDPAMGARPMERLIQDKIKRALADELLFGELSQGGGHVVVSETDGELIFSVTSSKKQSDVPRDPEETEQRD